MRSADTIDDEVEDGALVVEPDEDAYHRHQRVDRGRSNGRSRNELGPHPLRDDEVDADQPTGRAARRRNRDAEEVSTSTTAVVGVVLASAVAAGLAAIFVSPFAGAAVAGAAGVGYVVRRAARAGANARSRRASLGAGLPAAGSGRRLRDRLGGKGTKKAGGPQQRGAARRAGLLDGLAGKGKGRGGPGAGGKGPGGGGGRGPKGGPKAGPTGGGKSRNPLKNLMNKRAAKKAAAGAAKSPGVGPAGKSPKRSALATMLKGGPARQAARAQKAAAAKTATGRAGKTSATGAAKIPGRLAAMMPGRRGAAARTARAAARHGSGVPTVGSKLKGRLSKTGPAGKTTGAPGSKPGPAAKGKKAARNATAGPAAGKAGKPTTGAASPAPPTNPMTMRQLMARAKTNRRAKAARQQEFYLTRWWPMWGRRLRTAARTATVVPTVAAARYGVAVPSRWLWRHTTGLAKTAYARGKRRALLDAEQARTNRARNADWVRGFGRALLGRATPQWWRDLTLLASIKGRGSALAAAFMAVWAGLIQAITTALQWSVNANIGKVKHAAGGRLHLDEEAVTAEHVHARPAGIPPGQLVTPRHRRPQPATPAPTSTAPGTTQPASTLTAAATPSTGGTMHPETRAGQSVGNLLEIPGGLHPRHVALLGDALTFHALFNPKSFPDLAIYFRGTGEALRQERTYWKAIADQLTSEFPGFILIQSFAARVMLGYTELAQSADNAFRDFRVLHAADFGRFDNPRVNEQYADVRRWGGASGPMQLADGSLMHGSHSLFLYSVAHNLTGYQPGEADEDKVQDLRWWLSTLSAMMETRARFGIHFTNNLMGSFPAEHKVKDVYDQMSLAFCGLADYASELSTSYENRNIHDTTRRDAPKPNESLRDVGNVQMTNSSPPEGRGPAHARPAPRTTTRPPHPRRDTTMPTPRNDLDDDFEPLTLLGRPWRIQSWLVPVFSWSVALVVGLIVRVAQILHLVDPGTSDFVWGCIIVTAALGLAGLAFGGRAYFSRAATTWCVATPIAGGAWFLYALTLDDLKTSWIPWVAWIVAGVLVTATYYTVRVDQRAYEWDLIVDNGEKAEEEAIRRASTQLAAAQSPPVDKDKARWEAWTDAAGLGTTTKDVDGVETRNGMIFWGRYPTRAGFALHYEVPDDGSVNYDAVVSRVGALETQLFKKFRNMFPKGVRPGIVRVERARNQDGQEIVGEIFIHVDVRDVLAKIVRMPQGDDDYTELSILNAFPVGEFIDGEPIYLTLHEIHVLIVGQTQHGKSNLIDVLIRQLARCTDVVIWGLDFKGGDTLRLWMNPYMHGKIDPHTNRPLARGIFDWVAVDDHVEAERMILAALQAAKKRPGIVGGGGWIPSKTRPAILVIGDEISEVVGLGVGAGGETSTYISPEKIAGYLSRLFKLGAGQGVYGVTATQRGDVGSVGGGGAKSQQKGRIVLPLNGASPSDVLQGSSVETKQLAAGLTHKGTVVIEGWGTEGKPGRIWLVGHKEEIQAVVEHEVLKLTHLRRDVKLDDATAAEIRMFGYDDRPGGPNPDPDRIAWFWNKEPSKPLLRWAFTHGNAQDPDRTETGAAGTGTTAERLGLAGVKNVFDTVTPTAKPKPAPVQRRKPIEEDPEWQRKTAALFTEMGLHDELRQMENAVLATPEPPNTPAAPGALLPRVKESPTYRNSADMLVEVVEAFGTRGGTRADIHREMIARDHSPDRATVYTWVGKLFLDGRLARKGDLYFAPEHVN